MAIRPPAEAHSVNVENSLAIEMSEKKTHKAHGAQSCRTAEPRVCDI